MSLSIWFLMSLISVFSPTSAQVEIANCPSARDVTVNAVSSTLWQFIYEQPLCRAVAGVDVLGVATCFPPSGEFVETTVNSITCTCVDFTGQVEATCTVDQNVNDLIQTVPAGTNNIPVDFQEPFVPGITLVSSSHQPRSSMFCLGTTEVIYLFVNTDGGFSCVCFNVILEEVQIQFQNTASATINEGDSVIRNVCFEPPIASTFAVPFFLSPSYTALSFPTTSFIPASHTCTAVQFLAVSDGIQEGTERFQISLSSNTLNVVVNRDQLTISVTAATAPTVVIPNCPSARDVTVNIVSSTLRQFIYEQPFCTGVILTVLVPVSCFPPSGAIVETTVNSITCTCIGFTGQVEATCTVDQNVNDVIRTLPIGINNIPVDFPEPFVPGLTLISSSHQPSSSTFCLGTTEVIYVFVNTDGDFSCVCFNVILEEVGIQFENISPATINEGDSVIRNICFDPPIASTFDVAFFLSPSNADVLFPTSSFIPAGQTCTSVQFFAVSDGIQEGTETFQISLSSNTVNVDVNFDQFTISVTAVADRQTCLPGWQEINDRCFLAVSGPNLPTSFESRRLECLRRRGDIAMFEPWESFSIVLSSVFTFPEYYIGLTNLGEDGNFRWVSDNTIPSMPFPWASSQPSGGSLENCVTVVNTPLPLWSDTTCTLQLPFICERPVDNPRNCGTGPLTSRIIGGSDVDEGEWPWHGALEVFGINICGVTLISEEWAITSPQCLGINHVVFGDRRESNIPPSPNRQESDVTWFVHPGFNPITLEYDIAFLYLHTPVTFTDFVRPACIYNTIVDQAFFPPELIELTNCHITGWGAVTNGFDFPNILQEAPVDILSPFSCANYGERFVPRIMLCAGNVDASVDSCTGDGGGALICQRTGSQIWYLTGITSFGDVSGCAVADFPGVYTRIATTRQFVQNTQSLASTLLRCADSGRVFLENQVCDNIVDCDDYSDEIGCDPLGIGQTVQLNSPKFGFVTNFINRRWIFTPSIGRTLTVTVTVNTLPGSGSLTYLTSLASGAVPQPVSFVNPGGVPVTFFGSGSGEPVVLSLDKTAINSLAGFQATISG
ncbi:Transmembrane protease serine 9 [Holothuria leucospilota]|uniref:Transmembrane protease serine 9 n=1 Tax=Holothuria leucospilota TaxID=206669 RepID=A0A9Q0YD63_HOLLE|nr:Transmembrane protease serine 9 [Holothuria leucospilota]